MYVVLYLENQIPEMLFSTENEQLDGISAVKALAIASQQGQKIYTLTSQNVNLLSEITIDIASRQEIQSALNAGKEVTVHEQPINEFGWTGSGYVIVDPDTGAGAYKLNGGGNGGFLGNSEAAAWGLIGLGAALSGGFLPLILSIVIAINLILEAFIDYVSASSPCKSDFAPMIGALVLISLLSILIPGSGAIVMFYSALITGGATMSAINNRQCT